MEKEIKMINPLDLESNYRDGCYITHGKCVIKHAKTKTWFKATMDGSSGYERYRVKAEPCELFPNGGEFTVDMDNRWGGGTALEIRMVPDELWELPIKQEELSEHEKLVMELKRRSEEGERILGMECAKMADDWIIVCIGNDSKYGRVAYSKSANVMRGLTFDEFYGGGIVD